MFMHNKVVIRIVMISETIRNRKLPGKRSTHMNKILAVCIAAVLLILLVGCGSPQFFAGYDFAGYVPNQSVSAYAYTDGGYVGQAVVTTDDKGLLTLI